MSQIWIFSPIDFAWCGSCCCLTLKQRSAVIWHWSRDCHLTLKQRLSFEAETVIGHWSGDCHLTLKQRLSFDTEAETVIWQSPGKICHGSMTFQKLWCHSNVLPRYQNAHETALQEETTLRGCESVWYVCDYLLMVCTLAVKGSGTHALHIKATTLECWMMCVQEKWTLCMSMTVGDYSESDKCMWWVCRHHICFVCNMSVGIQRWERPMTTGRNWRWECGKRYVRKHGYTPVVILD